jgi:hypothetical protein
VALIERRKCLKKAALIFSAAFLLRRNRFTARAYCATE